MRVLIWMASIGERVPGGHRVQLEQTQKHLRDLNVTVDVQYSDAPEVRGYDLVHGFGVTPQMARMCRIQGIPLAVSTIYWSRAYVMGLEKPTDWDGLKQRFRIGGALLRSVAQKNHVTKCQEIVEGLTWQRIKYEMADILLPNSEMEAEAVLAETGVTTPMRVAPNAVDHLTFRLPESAAETKRDHVLYAGRFEPHKNQLGFIEAMRGSSVPVVLVGPPHPDHLAYYEQCKKRATGNIKILPGVPHDELPKLYQAAKAHILPSWFETTGLVSLEAALCGCNIVTTERGYARAYFQDYAEYCNPADPASIRKAVEAAFHAPFQDGLRQRILNNFTWEHTARATLAAYEQALESRRPAAESVR